MRTLFISMCCVVLLAASAAQADYFDDFESYNPPAASWDYLKNMYGASGWERQYEIGILRESTRIYDLPTNPGYTGQGIYAGNENSGDARAVTADLRTANATVGVQAKFTQLDNNHNSFLYLGSDCLVASGATTTVADNSYVMFGFKGDGRGYGEYRHNGVEDWESFGGIGTGGWYLAGWFELRLEVDLNANSRPTNIRGMWRDFDSGAPDALDWIQVFSGTFTATGDDWTTTHAAFNPGQWNSMDDFLLAPPYEAGDVNGDGFVGAVDMTRIVTNWGLTGSATREQGDLNGDRDVGAADYNEVLNNWGNGVLPPEAPGAVPEPSTLFLLTGGVLAGLIRRR